MLHTLVRLGDTERARQALADLGEQDRQRGEILIAEVTLRLAQDDPQAATPAPPGAPWSARSISPSPTACSCGSCCTPAPGLLERHAWQPAAHAALPAEIRSLLAGRHPASPPAGPQPPLSNSEIRVLRSLPANLSMPEIASELYVSLNTIRTHMRNLYAKLGTHRRAGAAARARAPACSPLPAQRPGAIAPGLSGHPGQPDSLRCGHGRMPGGGHPRHAPRGRVRPARSWPWSHGFYDGLPAGHGTGLRLNRDVISSRASP
jgi:LuxR family transcriptional regulator, maltose regulon positive regulatory protein